MRALLATFVTIALGTPLIVHAKTPPKKEQGSCSALVDSKWTQQEALIWKNVCSGDLTDLESEQGYEGKLNPRRVIRPAFLETILLNEPYTHAFTHEGLVLRGARFLELIDLSHADLHNRIVFEDSTFEDSILLDETTSSAPIELTDSEVRGGFSAKDASFRSLSLARTRFNEDVDLSRTRLQGKLTLNSSIVTGTLNMEAIDAQGSAFLRKGHFSTVKLAAAHFGHTLILDGSVTTRLLDMNGLHLDRSLFFKDGAEAAEINLSAAHVGGNIYMIAAKVSEDVRLSGAHIAGSLYIFDSDLNKLNLTLSHFGVQLGFERSKIHGFFSCNSAQIAGPVIIKNVAFERSVDCTSARIAGTFDLENTKAEGAFDLSGAQIDGALALTSASWSHDSALLLEDASLRSINLADSWPSKLTLAGLGYKSVTAPEKYREWLGILPRFISQPYDQIASVVSSQGSPVLATEIRYAARERERDESSYGRRAWLTPQKWIIGYGYYPQRSIPWAITFVLLGAVVLRITKEGKRNGMPIGLAFSFDMLLPIIQLRKIHYDVDLQGWARYYFYFHKIMGYVLASFLIASLSGLTK